MQYLLFVFCGRERRHRLAGDHLRAGIPFQGTRWNPAPTDIEEASRIVGAVFDHQNEAYEGKRPKIWQER